MSIITITDEENILISSDPDQGAINVSSDGSVFEVNFQEPITIPKEAINTQIIVEEASVWWTVPNIITGVNDTMYITVPNVADVLTAYVVVIPQGLYDLSALNQSILRELQNQGAKFDPSIGISLSPDDATGKVEIIFYYIGCEVDFTQNNTPRTILGFNSQILGPNVSAPLTQIADNVAEFNQVNSFLIHSDLTDSGIRINGTYNQVISQVLIDVSPGRQIISKPFNPARISSQELAGVKRTKVKFWLTDENGNPVNTNGEYWTARVVIKFLMPHIVE
jgi:hypothetical protein